MIKLLLSIKGLLEMSERHSKGWKPTFDTEQQRIMEEFLAGICQFVDMAKGKDGISLNNVQEIFGGIAQRIRNEQGTKLLGNVGKVLETAVVSDKELEKLVVGA